jgi:hypothetical protein
MMNKKKRIFNRIKTKISHRLLLKQKLDSKKSKVFRLKQGLTLIEKKIQNCLLNIYIFWAIVQFTCWYILFKYILWLFFKLYFYFIW